MWLAESNEGISLDSLSSEIAVYKSKGNFREDYAELQSIFQVQGHPKLNLTELGLTENVQCSIRNHVLDTGTLKCLICLLPLHQNVTELYLYNVAMSRFAVNLLSTTLPRCVSLMKLHIDYNRLDDPSVFAKILAVNMPARSISLRGNDLRDAGAISLAQALAKNTWVQTLNLFGNQIGDRGGTAIVSKLRYNTMLKSLSLSCNACADGTFIGLLDTLTGCEISGETKADYHRYASRVTELNKLIASRKKTKAKSTEEIPPNVEEIPALRSIFTVDQVDFFPGNHVLEMVNLSCNDITDKGASLAIKRLSRQSVCGLESQPLPQSTWEIMLANNQIRQDLGGSLSHSYSNRIYF